MYHGRLRFGLELEEVYIEPPFSRGKPKTKHTPGPVLVVSLVVETLTLTALESVGGVVH